MLSNLQNFFLHWNFNYHILTSHSGQHCLESSYPQPRCLSQGFASPKCVFLISKNSYCTYQIESLTPCPKMRNHSTNIVLSSCFRPFIEKQNLMRFFVSNEYRQALEILEGYTERTTIQLGTPQDLSDCSLFHECLK